MCIKQARRAAAVSKAPSAPGRRGAFPSRFHFFCSLTLLLKSAVMDQCLLRSESEHLQCTSVCSLWAISEHKPSSDFASASPYARQGAKVQAGYAANETNKIISKSIG